MVGPDPIALIQIRDRFAAHAEALRPGPDGAFVAIYTTQRKSIIHIRDCGGLVDASASGSMRLRVRRILGDSINVSVTFVAIPLPS